MRYKHSKRRGQNIESARRTKPYKHTKRHGFLLGFVDFFTAGLFFLLYMPLGGLQKELEQILGHPIEPYRRAYLRGIPNLFLYTLKWMARNAEELRAKARELGVAGPHTSYRHMFGWNVFGLPLCGPMVATKRFFDTLNRVEEELNRRGEQ
ncbi:MAG: hypothetical protein IJK63_09865 [Oscillospiraceae bacterium]|nr:hypothetical protein [Oscillospiraceae bacterium]